MAVQIKPLKSPTRFSRRPLILLIVLIIAVPLTYYLYNYSFLSPRNYAQEVAQPLEDALIKAGAVKKCSASDNGRGVANREPNYSAYYEISGNIEQASEKIRSAAAKTGLRLTDGPNPPNPQDNKFYSDQDSKASPYDDLNQGNIKFRISVLAKEFYTEEDAQFCTVREIDSRPADRTTFNLTVNMPEFKR